MLRLGLLRRYCLLVLGYGLQFSVIGCFLSLAARAYIATFFGHKPPTAADIPWTYLNTFALSGPFAGAALQHVFHTEERYLYLNHGLSWLLRFLPAALLVWLLAAFGSIGLRLGDGRIRPTALMQQSQQWQQLLGSGLAGWLVRFPLALPLAAASLAIVLLFGLLLLLSGHEELPDEAPEDWILAIDSVSHSFGRRQVLKGAWLNLRSAEVLGLLGRNGCGKSTLLQILYGTLKADFRALSLNQQPIRRAFRIPGLIAYLSQQSFLPRRMRVAKAIRLFAGPAALKRLRREQPRIAELLRSRVGQLSGGEKRLLDLSLVLALERPFVLLDEPFSELEPLYKPLIRELIRQAASAGTGIIVTDHDYRQILQVSSRVMLMHGGQTRPVADLRDLERIYLPLSE